MMKLSIWGKRCLGALAAGWIGLSGAMAHADEGMKTAEALDGAIAIKSQEAVQYVPVTPRSYKVPWAQRPIEVDGNLDDWKDLGQPAVVLEGDQHATWFRGTYGGKEDLSASVWLRRDENNLYVAVKIEDDHLPAAGRVSLAFTDAKMRPILGWRDVGMRYGSDDVHTIFVLGEDGSVGMHWAHAPRRMDREAVQDSFGSEAERLALLQQSGPRSTAQEKIFAKSTRRVEGDKSVTIFEAAFPWKTLAPYVPVSYQPLKFNIAVEDTDGQAPSSSGGAVAWAPGLVGTYSGAHFVDLTFDPPTGRDGVDSYALVPTFQYINQTIPVEFSFYNPGKPLKGELELLASGKTVASTKVDLPSGYSTKKLPVQSEKLDEGRITLQGRLNAEGQPTQTITVHAPSADEAVMVRKVAEFEKKIATLEKNAETLEALYGQVKAKGLDTAYPLAYVTLQNMFIERCKQDLKAGDAVRVLANTAHLESLYQSSRDYMERILKDPTEQLKVPARFDPDKLVMKNGYYFDGDRPVFLWGPCVFWYLRKDQPLVIDLGFNSVVTEVPQDADDPEVKAHLETFYKAGVSMNGSMSVPSLAATGADAKKLGLLKEHPEMANVDPNNFLPFLVQHPIVRREIANAFNKSITFWKNFHGVRSYWLWNEPWYLNYSEMTRKDFIEQYLKPRYETVEALNKRWKSNYESFDEVQLIQWPDAQNYAPWYDFQQFRDDLLADFWTFLDKTAKENDPTKPTHVKFMAASLHSGNMEKYQQPFDIAGHDGSAGDRDVLFMDYMRSLFPDRPLVDTEVHIAYAGKEAVERVAWRLALHGLADGNWWCWHTNQNFSDSLANAESMHALTISGLDLQRLMDPYIYELNQKPTDVAVLFPDVVERRSDVKMVRMRFEVAPALYELGVRPFYVAESRAAQGELPKHKLLLAAESDYTLDSTYQAVLDYVKSGGTAVVMRGGFSRNEYGDPRDTSELIRLEGGEKYGQHARIYPLGEGKVICIDAIENQPDVVIDGGQSMRGGPLPENLSRRIIYRQVMDQAMGDAGLREPVRLALSDEQADNPSALFGLDWRSAKVNNGYTLIALGGSPESVKLVTDRPVTRIVNLITNKEVAPDTFKFTSGPNLYQIELED